MAVAFNEYFDTIVDDRLISENSINGQYIKNYVPDINALNKLIAKDTHIEGMNTFVNVSKVHGKKRQFKLGTICKNGEYFLLAFSKFDDQYCSHNNAIDNRSYIEYECDKAKEAGIKIVVLYNYLTVDRSKCPEAIRYTGTHLPMYYRGDDGKEYWNYKSINEAICG